MFLNSLDQVSNLTKVRNLYLPTSNQLHSYNKVVEFLGYLLSV